MTHTLIKRGQARGQGGFAIGLILLVVLLIAVIIAAIALATRNSSNKGNEKDRVAASNLIQQAVTFDQGAQRAATAAGAKGWQFYTSRNSASTNLYYSAGTNLFSPNGAFSGQPDVDVSVYENKCVTTALTAAGYVNSSDPTVLVAADVSPNGCQWHITTFWGANTVAPGVPYDTVATPNAAVGVLYTFPIRGSIGSQINNILWNVPVGTTLFRTTGTLGKNIPVSDSASAVQADFFPAQAVESAITGNTLTAANATSAFNQSFGGGGTGISASYTIPALPTTATSTTSTSAVTRFPSFLGVEHIEGVIQVGGTTTIDDSAVVDGSTALGYRAYFRSLNAPLVD